MMIRALLEKLILEVEACCAAVLVAPDGVAVDSVVVDEAVDSEILAAGAVEIVGRCERFVNEAGAEGLEELSLMASSMTFVLRVAAGGHRLLAVLGPSATSIAPVRMALAGLADRLREDLTVDQPPRADGAASRVDLGRAPGL